MDRPVDGSGLTRSPTATATVDNGTVRVTVRVERSIDVLWLALTDPERLSQWFGEMDKPWLVGRAARIELGDGDFFVVTATEITERKLLEFEWSFLGVGPLERIRWMVRAWPPYGAELVIEDHDPARTPAEIDQMVARWTDFAQRLERYLVTGEPSRYECRDEIDGSAELPPTGFEPLAIEMIYRWLPIATDGIEPRWFFIIDEDGPRRFRLDGWSLGLNDLAFTVEIPEAAVSTLCTVIVEPAGSGRRMRFSHTGWGTLGLPGHRARTLRSRFAASWVAAFEHARTLAMSGERPQER